MQYRKYDFAQAFLHTAGYEQQTHVRWALPGRGGYLQKEYHWAGEPVLGFGAGARSYLWNIDVRNGYSLRRRRTALEDYIARVEAERTVYTDGFVMDDDERKRKAVILGLNHLDRLHFRATFGMDPVEEFSDEFAVLSELNLVEESDRWLSLTDIGIRHRDVVVQSFVSKRVRRLVQEFDYAE